MNTKELNQMEEEIQNAMFQKTVKLTIELTPDQLEQLYFAAGMLYMDYEEHQSEEYNASIRKYNDEVDGIRQALKDAISLYQNFKKEKLCN